MRLMKWVGFDSPRRRLANVK